MRLLSPPATNVSLKWEFRGDRTSCQPIKPNLSPQAAGLLNVVLFPNSKDCLAHVASAAIEQVYLTVIEVTRLTGAFDFQKIN